MIPFVWAAKILAAEKRGDHAGAARLKALAPRR